MALKYDRDLAVMRAGAGREPMVSMQVLRGLVAAVELVGVPRTELLRASGLPADRLDSSDTYLARVEVDRVCERALELTGDPALGLHWAEGLSHRTFGPVSHMLAHAESLRHAFELLSRFARLFADEPFHELREARDTAELRVPSLADRSPSVRRFSIEMITAGLVRVMRSLCGEPRLQRVGFDYAAPAYHAEYVRVMGQPVLFGQPYTAIVFDRALLDKPSPNADEDMQSALTLLAERRMLLGTQQAPYAVRVRELLVKRAPARINMAAVARSLGLSVRSLRRRLSAEGKSYLECEHDALALIAKDLLRNRQRSIQEAAHEMGFSDSTTFHRAFKRWTGTTPNAFRVRPGRP